MLTAKSDCDTILVICYNMDAVRSVQPSQVVDNTERPSSFTAHDHQHCRTPISQSMLIKHHTKLTSDFQTI